MSGYERKVERVARAICHAAGTAVACHCIICEHPEYPEPCIWPTFVNEARAAIKAVKGF